MPRQADPFVSDDEYLEREANSIHRHEYLNGEMFLMAGGTLEHSAIATNVGAALGSQLTDTECIVGGSDARLR
jgi:Uma2 family endonuclease